MRLGERKERSVTECLVCCGAGRSRSTRVRSANSAASAMRPGNARQSCSIYAVSSPNPVRMVRSTSPVRRGSPHRCSAKPPMKQNFQPRSRQNDWMSFARRKRSRIPDSGKHRLLLHQPGGGAHRTCERRFERTIKCIDVVGHLDVAEFGPSQRRQPGAGDTPPFDERALFAVKIARHDRQCTVSDQVRQQSEWFEIRPSQWSLEHVVISCRHRVPGPCRRRAAASR